MEDGVKIRYRRTRYEQTLHAKARVGKLARQLTSSHIVVDGRACRFGEHSVRPVVRHTFTHIDPQGEPTSSDVGADILRRNIAYMKVSVGRRLHGAPKPTGRCKDHKNRKRVRVEHTLHTHAHKMDLQRTYTHKSAPFRPGGYMWAKSDRVGKRRLRSAVGMADKLALRGEITAALDFLLGSR